MKFENIIIREESYQNNKFYAVYFVISGKEYFVGTLKENKTRCILKPVQIKPYQK